ncbi:hypothetical protein E2C01_077936 [Portunus trituberculatus]|uniref:Uncharacterized protein n=1 Tax=Portunus trituberculatus TaxID=210409 RepID=A0A5B7IH91_PORTR|nr:hypothetical protein [Portunus trituberculatus]
MGYCTRRDSMSPPPTPARSASAVRLGSPV